MISITTIIKQEGTSCTIGFSAKDKDGCTALEGNIADVFRTTLSKTREAIFSTIPGAEGEEPVIKDVLVSTYQRTFDNPEERDAQAENLKAHEEVAAKLDPEIKKRANKAIEADPRMVASIVHTSFLAGMQLAMRICRNRATDLLKINADARSNEAETCAGMIRICQVEIGSGRMERPKFTKEELDELDRIS